MKILIVDDEKAYRDLLVRYLQREGHDAQSAASSEEAVEVSQRFSPQVLVVDWMLQNDHQGMDVADALQAQGCSMQTILMSGYPSAELEYEAQRRGVSQFLAKPFDPAQLLDAMREVTEPEEETVEA